MILGKAALNQRTATQRASKAGGRLVAPGVSPGYRQENKIEPQRGDTVVRRPDVRPLKRAQKSIMADLILA